MGLISFLAGLAPFAAMVALETILVGSNTLNKAAMSKGMSSYILVFYSNALAALILFPFAFFFQRARRPPLSFSLLCKFFLFGMIGITINNNCIYAGIDYGSPTLASAMRNLVPAFTFCLAVVFRMEKLNLRSSRSQVNILSTLPSTAGAIIIVFYKGPQIGPSSVSYMQSPDFLSDLLVAENSWAIGGIFLATSSVCDAIWIIAMGAILKEYPSEITIVAFYFLFASIQCCAVSLVADRNHPNAWKLSPDIELISVIYYALFASVVACCIEAWCIHKKGPLFVAMFKPLSIPVAGLVGFILLGEALHIGIIIGVIIVIMGLYEVIWAKSKENEEQRHSQDDFPHSSSQKMPLLQKSIDV